MATTVGQHSVAAFTSPVNGTTPIDANTVRGNDNTVRVAYVDHDADPGIHVQSSTLASRPAAGTAGRKWINSDYPQKLWYDDGTDWHEVGGDAITVYCKATEVIAKGDVVKVTGYNTGQDVVEIAKVSSASDVAFGIAETAIANGSLGYVINTGVIQGVATNAFSLGDILYPNTSGGFTATKPTSGNYQPVAYVLRSNANNGVLYVEFSAPRIVERSDNTASTIVLRDASGNFSAGTITAGAVTSTGLVTFASLKGTGATTVTNILDEDNMASDSATALATQQSIKAYVDAQVGTVDTLAEVLANGNTTGANNIIVSSGQKITTNTIDETTAAAGVTIDSVLLKDNTVTATTFNGTLNGAAPAGSLTGTTLASNVVSSSLTSVGTLANLTVTNPITGSVTGSSGSTTGNAATATALQTARNINGVSFNGTADITVTAAAGTLTGSTLASGVTASSLTSVGTLSSLTVSGTATAGQLNSTGAVIATGAGQFGDDVDISGDLTVDTSTLKVDSTNNRVGIDTASPAYPLQVRRAGGAGSLGISVDGVSGVADRTSQYFAIGDSTSDTTGHAFYTRAGTASNVLRLAIDSNGNLAVDTNTLYVDAANNRVGIGTASPGVDLDVSNATSVTGRLTTSNAGGYTEFKLANTGTSGRTYSIGVGGNTSAYPGQFFVQDATAGVNRLTLDASGNLGLGVTPDTWGAKVIQFANGIGYGTRTANGAALMTQNAILDGSDVWKYKANAAATAYQQVSGAHYWSVAGAGTGTITGFNSAAMTLDASGNLSVASSGGVNQMSLAANGTGTYTNVRVTNSNSTAGLSMGVGGSAVGATALQNNAYIWNTAASALSFGTSDTERARITSGGYFKASNDGTYANVAGLYHEFRNTTTTDWTVRATHSAASPYGIYVSYTGAAPNGTGNEFLYCEDSSAQRAAIRSNGGLANYSANNVNLASDFRLKKDIAPLASTWDKLKAIEVVNFRYKDCNEDDPALYGVIAQQVQPIVPELVVVTREAVEAKDAELDEDGNEVKPAVEAAPEYYGIREQPMYWLAIKALQEAQARIEALEARLEALEA